MTPKERRLNAEIGRLVNKLNQLAHYGCWYGCEQCMAEANQARGEIERHEVWKTREKSREAKNV